MHNLDIKTDLKKTIKTFKKSIDEKKIEEAQVNLKTLYKKIDKATKRNLLPQNTASRRKSLFSNLLKNASNTGTKQ
jgi:ribosomal protein S20